MKVCGRSHNLVACAPPYVHNDNRVEACIRAYVHAHAHGNVSALCVQNDILGHDEEACDHNHALVCVVVACAPLCAHNDIRAHGAVACAPLCGHNDIQAHDGTVEVCDHTDLQLHAVSLVACPQTAPFHLAAS